MDNEAAAVRKLDELLGKRVPLAIAAPSVFELFSGIARSARPAREQEKVTRVLQQQVEWPLDHESAAQAGHLQGRLAKEGQAIDAIDTMIAGIALRRQEAVLTRNVRHFSRVKGLRIETY